MQYLRSNDSYKSMVQILSMKEILLPNVIDLTGIFWSMLTINPFIIRGDETSSHVRCYVVIACMGKLFTMS